MAEKKTQKTSRSSATRQKCCAASTSRTKKLVETEMKAETLPTQPEVKPKQELYEREKRRWIADTVRDIAIAILGGLVSLSVSLLLLAI